MSEEKHDGDNPCDKCQCIVQCTYYGCVAEKGRVVTEEQAYGNDCPMGGCE